MNVLSGKASKSIEKIVPEKIYTPRILDDLFKKNHSRVRKEKNKNYKNLIKQ